MVPYSPVHLFLLDNPVSQQVQLDRVDQHNQLDQLDQPDPVGLVFHEDLVFRDILVDQLVQ